MSFQTPSLTLPGSGQLIPQVGFGLWKVAPEDAADLVYEAIRSGYRLFDGAYDYGNEKEAGEGIQRAIADGLIKREDVFVTTKLWNTCHQRQRAVEVATEQVKEWGLGYIDLYLIHFPIALEYNPECTRGWYFDGESQVRLEPTPIRDTWEALEELHNKGLVKNIGVSNFNSQAIFDIFTYAKIKPSMLQIEHHPYLVQRNLTDFCNDQGILVTGYSSFGPQSFLELPPSFPTKASATPSLFKVPLIINLAAKYNKTSAQILLRWATQRGICVIPKSIKQSRMAENLDVTGFDMEQEELDKIAELDMGLHFNDPGVYLPGRPLRLFT
ncbi:NADP-dependent oxidoreductase domain-containing protein [Dactylonectria estremocensis]|uniref:NADP-dependent oxidoreductase domain-containing protein n=1 Tax=Dactylonectria estremocensis TaxID=1079267 RepID=A0A9P9IHH0_9HYPO|nr:NADP-dependent oxidoreductase domain-containing protein [Dactylonectria estremocensis]